MGRERFARRQSKLRWQVCSIGMLTRSPTMAADAWCATAIPYPHHGKARAAIAVRCPRVRDRGGQGSERIRFSLALLPPYARHSKSLK